jgi:hypothetical protein
MTSGLNFLVNLFTRRQRLRISPPPPRVALTLAEFCERPDLIAEARRVQSDPYFRLQLEVLLNEAPTNYHDPRANADRALGQIEGYHLALNNLAAMAATPGEKITLEATFEPEQRETP